MTHGNRLMKGKDARGQEIPGSGITIRTNMIARPNGHNNKILILGRRILIEVEGNMISIIKILVKLGSRINISLVQLSTTISTKTTNAILG